MEASLRSGNVAWLLVAGLAIGCAGGPAHRAGPYRTPGHAVQGAILGGMAGAAIGAGVDHRDRGRGALLGGLGGVIVGAIFGEQIEQHEAWHRAHDAPDPHLDCEEEHVWRDDEHLRHGDEHVWEETEEEAYEDAPPLGESAVFTADVIFDPGSPDLSRGAESRLRELARQVRDRPDIELLLRGHSDGIEGDGFDLSEERARVVRSFLAEQGVPPRRIAWVGFGSTQPVASNDTAVGRQRNRRVEVVLREPEPWS